MSRRWVVCSVTVCALFAPLAQRAAQASTIVIPTANTAVEGNTLYGLTGALTAQEVYGASLLAGIPIGATIDGISFRLNAASSTGPSSPTTVTNFDVYIGPSAFAPGSLSMSAAANEGAGTVLARSGSLAIPANSYVGGSGPNPFGPLISFTTPYVYTGGDLLLTLSYTALSGAGLLLDAQGSVAGAQEVQGNGYNQATMTSGADQYALIAQFDFTAPGASAVPEPATATLAALGISALFGDRYRRRRARR